MSRVRWTVLACTTVAAALLGGCASMGVGVSVPLGRAAGVGISLGSDGQVGVGLGVGRGGVSLGVGGATQWSDRFATPPRTVHRGAPQWE